jgi:flagellar basal-body rod protein FlgC
MVASLDSALSALQAFGQKLGLTAGNIANVNTDGFKKSRAVFQEGRHGEVTVSEQRVNSPGIPLEDLEEEAADGGATRESSNVALEEEIPELITSVYGFRANLKTVKAQDEVLGHLLDIVG